MALAMRVDEGVAEFVRRKKGVIVVDLRYKRGTCDSAFCVMVPSIAAHLQKKRKGLGDFVSIRAEGEVHVYVARAIVKAAEGRDVVGRIYLSRFPRDLRVKGIDIYELGL